MIVMFFSTFVNLFKSRYLKGLASSAKCGNSPTIDTN